MTRSLVALALVLCAASARAVEFDEGDWKIDLSANLREILTLSREIRADTLQEEFA